MSGLSGAAASAAPKRVLARSNAPVEAAMRAWA